MKMLKKIKWENIFGIVFGAFDLIAIVKHIILNGFNWCNISYEIALYSIFTFGLWYAIKSVRLDN